MSSLSAIIPVYNKAPFLKRCLDSLVRQSDQSAQIILVDDGSTDDSGKICDRYADKYGWKVYHTKNKGVGAARNFGISKAKGDYIAFMDADDCYTDDAVWVMSRIAERGYNIVQFGQYRHLGLGYLPVERGAEKGWYELNETPKYWQMVWNKMYRAGFIKERKLKFKTNVDFGEDEMFNVECLLASGGLYHAPQTLVHHYFDDKNSLCRKGLKLEKLDKLDKMLKQRRKKLVADGGAPEQVEWLSRVIVRHHQSKTFRKLGFKESYTGKHDVVYFVKDVDSNEELRYSLRSLETNWQFREVWFYGGCPNGLKPDHHVGLEQTAPSKWEKVRSMLYQACLNDELTDNFWLFNDDFFVLKFTGEDMPPQYNGTLENRIERIERRHGGIPNEYTKRLRHLVDTLDGAGLDRLNYAVHKPILINRKKMLEVLDKFPDEPMSRALYGNYWKIGGVSEHDMKIQLFDYDIKKVEQWPFVSTDDRSWLYGTVGEFLREKFNQRSRFEV